MLPRNTRRTEFPTLTCFVTEYSQCSGHWLGAGLGCSSADHFHTLPNLQPHTLSFVLCALSACLRCTRLLPSNLYLNARSNFDLYFSSTLLLVSGKAAAPCASKKAEPNLALPGMRAASRRPPDLMACDAPYYERSVSRCSSERRSMFNFPNFFNDLDRLPEYLLRSR